MTKRETDLVPSSKLLVYQIRYDVGRCRVSPTPGDIRITLYYPQDSPNGFLDGSTVLVLSYLGDIRRVSNSALSLYNPIERLQKVYELRWAA